MKKLLNDKGNDWLPDYYALDVKQINFDYLRNKGVKACFFDLDHTLLIHGTVDLDKETVRLLKATKIDLYIATNRRYSPTLDEIAKQIGAKGVMHAKSRTVAKPSKKYFKQAMRLTGLKPEQMAMVGDRLIQDIWGANRVGINTIMVAKFGKIKWYDQLLTIHDRLLPVIFKSKYKDI